MNFDSLFDKLFWVVFVGILASFAWKMWKNGGLRGAMFGSKVERLIGEVTGERSAMHSLKVRVHKLEGAEGKGIIGVEIVAKSVASYQMTPITLSRDAALQLAEHLRTAAGQASARI
jgi:hypothetical protein